MANEPIYNVAAFDCKEKLCSAQTVVETRLLPMGGISISKVLSYSAHGQAAASDVFTGEARIAGRVTFSVLFLDAEGGCRSIETAAEFTDKITGDTITGGRPEIISRILDLDIVSVAADEIKLAAIIEMDLYDNASSRIKYLAGAGADVYSHEEKTGCLKLVSKSSETFSVSEEVKAEGDKILLAETAAVPLRIVAGTDNVKIEGEVITNLVTQKNGEIFAARIKTPFSNETPAEGCRPDCFADGAVKVLKTSASMMLDGDDAAVNLEYDISASVYVYDEQEISPVADAFSITNELSLTISEIPVTKNTVCKTVFERVEGSVTLAQDMPVADKILASAGSRLNIANAYISGDKLVLEGTITSSIIYFSAETGTKNSVDVELPFSITTMESMNGKITAAYGEVTQLSPKLRRGNEIDIKAEIAVVVCAAEVDTVRVITDLVLGEPIESPAAPISLHIARPKEALWDVAKALKTTPELILLQNPDLKLPLTGGERVIVYRHLKKV